VAVCAGLGLVTTILAAWGPLMWMAGKPGTGAPPVWSSVRVRGNGIVGLTYLRENGRHSYMTFAFATTPGGQDFGPEMDTAPAWVLRAIAPWRARLDPWPGPSTGTGYWVAGVGWPLPALYSVAQSGVTREQEPALAAQGWKKGWFNWMYRGGWLWKADAILAVYPVWPGLLADTAMFGAAWWCVLFLRGTVARALRRRRGACLRCGYDLRATAASQPCPECGDVRDQGIA
jgi:hypothetical protein